MLHKQNSLQVNFIDCFISHKYSALQQVVMT